MVLISILSRLGGVCCVSGALSSVGGSVRRIAGTLCAGCRRACGAGSSLGSVGRVFGALGAISGSLCGFFSLLCAGRLERLPLLGKSAEDLRSLVQQTLEVPGRQDCVGYLLGQAGYPGGDFGDG